MNHLKLSTILHTFSASSTTFQKLLQPLLVTTLRRKGTQLDSKHIKKIARVPRHVYQPGEELPKPGGRSIINAEELKHEASARYVASQKQRDTNAAPPTSSLLFSKVVCEIDNNKNRKQIILEGARLIEEALKAGQKLDYLFLMKSIKEVPEELKVLLNDDVSIHRVNEKHMQVWSSVTTQPGVVGICKKPGTLQDIQEGQIPLTIICDNIREPGNLGSILRSAVGAGCKRVLLSKGCVDIWNAKVLRGGCGAHFHIPIMTDLSIDSLGNYIDQGEVTSNEDTDCNDSSSGSHSLLRSTAVFLADSKSEDSRSDLPIQAYTDLNYYEYNHIYLILGGETHGLSDESLKVSNNFFDRVRFPSVSKISRIHIPMYQNFNSLNAANALGIIVFEIARQLKQRR